MAHDELQGFQDLGVPNAVGVDPDSVQSNVVLVRIGPDLTDSEVGMSASVVCDRLREKGVLAMTTMPDIIRFVTHSQVGYPCFAFFFPNSCFLLFLCAAPLA